MIKLNTRDVVIVIEALRRLGINEEKEAFRKLTVKHLRAVGASNANVKRIWRWMQSKGLKPKGQGSPAISLRVNRKTDCLGWSTRHDEHGL